MTHQLTILTTDSGFRAKCSCGWQGDERKHVSQANSDHIRHIARAT